MIWGRRGKRLPCVKGGGREGKADEEGGIGCSTLIPYADRETIAARNRKLNSPLNTKNSRHGGTSFLYHILEPSLLLYYFLITCPIKNFIYICSAN